METNENQGTANVQTKRKSGWNILLAIIGIILILHGSYRFFGITFSEPIQTTDTNSNNKLKFQYTTYVEGIKTLDSDYNKLSESDKSTNNPIVNKYLNTIEHFRGFVIQNNAELEHLGVNPENVDSTLQALSTTIKSEIKNYSASSVDEKEVKNDNAVTQNIISKDGFTVEIQSIKTMSGKNLCIDCSKNKNYTAIQYRVKSDKETNDMDNNGALYVPEFKRAYGAKGLSNAWSLEDLEEYSSASIFPDASERVNGTTYFIFSLGYLGAGYQTLLEICPSAGADEERNMLYDCNLDELSKKKGYYIFKIN